MRLRNTLGGVAIAAGNMNNIPSKPQFFRTMFVNKNSFTIRSSNLNLKFIAIDGPLPNQRTAVILNKANVRNLFHSRVYDPQVFAISLFSDTAGILRIKMNIPRVVRQGRSEDNKKTSSGRRSKSLFSHH